MADKPEKLPGGKERRGSPEFRARAQEGYDVLRELITQHGKSDIATDLADKKLIEDVMRAKPEMVGALLSSAWQLRTHDNLKPYFQTVESETNVVTEYDQPIGPCARTYEDTVQSHLYGAARLFLSQRENRWVRARLANPEKLSKELTGGAGNMARRMVGMKLKVDEPALREMYPGRGLYETLKPFLIDEAQFKLVPAYAELSTKGASIIGDILEKLRSTSALRVACSLDPATLMNARSCAIAYAESELFNEAEEGKKETRKRNANELRRDKELMAKVKQRTADVFATILNDHVESIGFVEQHKAGAEQVVRSLAPLFKEETWSVLAVEGAVENVINCPPTVAKYLGRDSRYVNVEISKFINQLQYPDIGRDLIKILREDLDDDKLFHRVLSDKAAIEVWATVPGNYNNQMKYQHDAKGTDTTITNFKTLKAGARSLIRDFKEALGLDPDKKEDDAKGKSKS